MDNSGTGDLGLVARLMYSHILSNTSVLNGADTSFVMIAALIPQDVWPAFELQELTQLTPIGKSAIERASEGSFEWRGNFRAGTRSKGSNNQNL